MTLVHSSVHHHYEENVSHDRLDLCGPKDAMPYQPIVRSAKNESYRPTKDRGPCEDEQTTFT